MFSLSHFMYSERSAIFTVSKLTYANEMQIIWENDSFMAILEDFINVSFKQFRVTRRLIWLKLFVRADSVQCITLWMVNNNVTPTVQYLPFSVKTICTRPGLHETRSD